MIGESDAHAQRGVMDVDHFGGNGQLGGDGRDDTISMGSSIPPPPRGGGWWTSRVAVFAGVAGLALAGGAGIGYAATSSSSGATANTAAAATSPSPSAAPTSPATPVPARPGHGSRGWSFGGPLGFGLGGGVDRGGVLHGQFTVRKPGGGYETLDVQDGTASAVSGTSLTVKSADGYTATYSVTGSTLVDAKANGIGSVKKGDTVVVTATAGSTPKAASVMDVTAIRAGRASLGFTGHGFPGHMRAPKLIVPSASPAAPTPPVSPGSTS